MSIDIATWVLAVFTAGLVWVTWRLAKHTKSLAFLTKQLVQIEEQREARISHDKRLRDISKALPLAEKIRRCDASFYSSVSGNTEDPQIEEDVRKLALLSKYMQDSEAVKLLVELRALFDKVDMSYSSSEVPTITDVLFSLQHLLGKSITPWRDELLQQNLGE